MTARYLNLISCPKKAIIVPMAYHILSIVVHVCFSNNSDATLVNFGMAAIRIIDFDEESHVITLRAWLRYVSYVC